MPAPASLKRLIAFRPPNRLHKRGHQPSPTTYRPNSAMHDNHSHSRHPPSPSHRHPVGLCIPPMMHPNPGITRARPVCLTNLGPRKKKSCGPAGESQMTESTRIGRGGSGRSRLLAHPCSFPLVTSPPKSVSAPEEHTDCAPSRTPWKAFKADQHNSNASFPFLQRLRYDLINPNDRTSSLDVLTAQVQATDSFRRATVSTWPTPHIEPPIKQCDSTTPLPPKPAAPVRLGPWAKVACGLEPLSRLAANTVLVTGSSSARRLRCASPGR